MTKRKLTDTQEREVALSYLCHVSPEYVQDKYGVSDVTVSQWIVGKRSKHWNDPLVEFYREVKKSGNRYGNATHLYLVFENQAEGLPKIELVDKRRDFKVYEAVDEDIFERRKNILLEQTGLDVLLGALSQVEDTPASKLLHTIFGAEGFRGSQIDRIVTPSLYQRLREAYQNGNVDITKVYSEVNKDVLNYLSEALRMRANKETKAFFDGKEREFRNKLEEVLDTLTYREREIVQLRYGLGDGLTYTIEEVGHIFKVTRERVRQVEAKAIRKLQHPSRANALEGLFLGEEKQKADVYALQGKTDYSPEEKERILKFPISRFDFSVRAGNTLKALGLKTIGDLTERPEIELLSYRYCGETTLSEIKQTLLRPYGLDFKQEKYPQEE